MYGLHIAAMTGRASTAVGRNPRLQIRNCGVAEATVTTMGDIDRRIFGSTRVVTIVTWAGQGHITGRDMIDAAVRRCISRMAIEAVGRVGA